MSALTLLGWFVRRAALVLTLSALSALCAMPSWAGQACRSAPPEPVDVQRAARLALGVRDALEANGAAVALLSRVGTDLSPHGLHYSHVGFVVRDHRDGRWTVLHLLNACGTDRSALFAEGLMNFFLDELVAPDARITWLHHDDAEALARLLADEPFLHALHRPRYNLLSPPDSRRSQNSTAWVLDVLEAAATVAHGGAPGPLPARRERRGFSPSVVHVPYSKRVLGGLFAANVDFAEHPLATRLSSQYPVVTVAAILDHLERRQVVAATREWRNGAWQATPLRP